MAPGLAGKGRGVLGKGLDESQGHEASSLAKEPGGRLGSHSERSGESRGCPCKGPLLLPCLGSSCPPPPLQPGIRLACAPSHAWRGWSCTMSHSHHVLSLQGNSVLGGKSATRVPGRRAPRSCSAKRVGGGTRASRAAVKASGGSHSTRMWKAKAKLLSSIHGTLRHVKVFISLDGDGKTKPQQRRWNKTPCNNPWLGAASSHSCSALLLGTRHV